jgi:hypothetical protein
MNTNQRSFGRAGRLSSFRLPLACIAAAFLVVAITATANAAVEKSADPLGDVVLDMKVATRWLSKATTNTITQETQKDAVERLDALIVELEKECEKCKGGQAIANPTKPLGDSVVKAGPGGSGKLHGTRDEGKHWAELPPHERQRIMQSMTEGFPAHYQNVLESYFKRVAEEKTVKADEAAPTAKQPSAPAAGKPATGAKAQE